MPRTALYYPFSRCLDPASLKQQLLLFDRICFLDPVDEDSWRAHLLREMEPIGGEHFAGYREIHDARGILLAEGALERISPQDIPALNDQEISITALGDLCDSAYTKVASRPDLFGMPARLDQRSGAFIWEIFRPKLPNTFLDALSNDNRLNQHLLHWGTKDTSWLLSYEAGSAITTAVHVAAAAHKKIPLVTDSTLHARLLWMTAARNSPSAGSTPLSPRERSDAAAAAALAVLDELIPRPALELLSFDDLLRFREGTAVIRREFADELERRIAVLAKPVDAEFRLQIGDELKLVIEKELREYRAELAAARSKFFPSAIMALCGTGAAGGLIAAALTVIGLGGTFWAMAVPPALGIWGAKLVATAEMRRVQGRASPGLAYLSRVKDLAGKVS